MACREAYPLEYLLGGFDGPALGRAGIRAVFRGCTDLTQERRIVGKRPFQQTPWTLSAAAKALTKPLSSQDVEWCQRRLHAKMCFWPVLEPASAEQRFRRRADSRRSSRDRENSAGLFGLGTPWMQCKEFGLEWHPSGCADLTAPPVPLHAKKPRTNRRRCSSRR